MKQAQRSDNTFKNCNLCIEIQASGLCLQTVIRDGKSSDPQKPIGILSKQLQSEKFKSKFISELSKLGKDYSLVIYRRTDTKGIDRILPGGERWNQKAWIALDNIDTTSLEFIKQLLGHIEYPGVTIQREIRRGDPLLTQPKLLINETIESLTKLDKILNLIMNQTEK
ncbi:hypothetical protein [Dehalococcoides mccartyi]|nr:hypothetical protein [Dehalococcoides mccartyi]MBJ7531183.1 hypothetical protein [Dehalococcoides mccartyi]